MRFESPLPDDMAALQALLARLLAWWLAPRVLAPVLGPVVLVLAERIQRVAGDSIVVALERLMGLVLVSVSIEMLLRGIKTFIKQLATAV